MTATQPKRWSSRDHAEPLIGITQMAIDVFFASKQNNGLIDGLGYWQVANGYTAVALHDSWSHTASNVDILNDLISKVEADQENCINDMNDDSMWWSMCLMEMFELSQNTQHLQVARNIWAHVKRYVLPQGKYTIDGVDMEGGVMWSSRENETQVNSITTGLFSELSARLAFVQSDLASRQSLLLSAIRSLSWILRCRFDRDEFIVLDNIDLQTGEHFNWTFTYNTGQAIAASMAIYNVMKDIPLPSSSNSNFFNSSSSFFTTTASSSVSASATQPQPHPPLDAETFLNLACTMASKAMTRPDWVMPNGTLTEPAAYPGTLPGNKAAWQNGDAVGFKSVLVRSLAKLYLVLVARDASVSGPALRQRQHHHHDTPDLLQTQLATFIERQFQSLRLYDTNGHDQYGPWWDGPMDLPTSHSQMAVMDVMAAAHAVRLGGGAGIGGSAPVS